MIRDIKKLVLIYATEPVYWFPKWIDRLVAFWEEEAANSYKVDMQIPSNNARSRYNWKKLVYYIPLLKHMKTNPRAARYLIDLYNSGILSNKNHPRIAENPSKKILGYLATSPEPINIAHLAKNKTDDPEFREFANRHITNYIKQEINKNGKIDYNIAGIIAEGPGDILCSFQKDLFRYFSSGIIPQDGYFSFSTESKKIAKKISENKSGVAMAILRENPQLIDYRSLNTNPRPEIIKLLNSEPEKIKLSILMNPNPTIITIIDAVVHNKQFVPDESNNALYNAISKMKINRKAIAINPGAILIVEKHLEFLDWKPEFLDLIYEIREFSNMVLPDTITPKIVDRLIELVKSRGYVRDHISKCNSPHLLRLYFECYSEVGLKGFTNVLRHNHWVLSENKYGHRLIDKVLVYVSIL